MYTPKQIVEIFHLTFIRHLEGKLDKNLYALKGGCNLRFFFKSIRYSEDIDFDVRTIAKETLNKKINKILESTGLIQNLKNKGIEILQVSEPKQTETTQRWKLSLRLVGLEMPIPTKIEFSRREMQNECVFEPVEREIIRAYQLYPIAANHYTGKAAFNQKINALINRTETQARDIFDLKLLIDLGVDITQLDSELKSNLSTAINNVLSIDFAEFKSQVVAYLMNEYQNYYNSPEIWHSIQEDVIKTIERIQT